MSKLLMFLFFCFIFITVLGATMEGGDGMIATTTTSNITSTAVVIPVASTAGSLPSDFIIIGNEQIVYTSRDATNYYLNSVTLRGWANTLPSSHSSGSAVYSLEASAINNALGFNIAADSQVLGAWVAITIPVKFLSVSMPRMAMLNFSFLGTGMAVIGYIWFALIASIVVTLAMMMFKVPVIGK